MRADKELLVTCSDRLTPVKQKEPPPPSTLLNDASNNTHKEVVNTVIYPILISNMKARGGTVVRGTAIQAGRSRVRFPMVSLEFFTDTKFEGA